MNTGPLDAEALTLGIETSCDDTGVALLRGERTVVGELLSSQIRDHSRHCLLHFYTSLEYRNRL